jgi:hypothetical protein
MDKSGEKGAQIAESIPSADFSPLGDQVKEGLETGIR